MPMPGKPNIGVVGLWHLGCTIAACWNKLGHRVYGVDRSQHVVAQLCDGVPPIYEPGLAELIKIGLSQDTLTFSTDPRELNNCDFVFLAYDTPVLDDDICDLTIIRESVKSLKSSLKDNSVIIVSSQVPVGTSRTLRRELQQCHPSVEVVCSPENLRLGQAISCYLNPGHIVVGHDSDIAAEKIDRLFTPIPAERLYMSLSSAEMTKHAINSFLAMSVTIANQWADLCAVVGADYTDVERAVRLDPRIGQKAYLSSGLGFSGGTLGRDLQALAALNREMADNVSPLFEDLWRYNNARRQVVTRLCRQAVGQLDQATIAIWGMTYKAGTSTLRRSLPLMVAHDLARCGTTLQVYDPKAAWSEVEDLPVMTICDSATDAVRSADMLLVMTEWPEFQTIDFRLLMPLLRQKWLFDAKNILQSRWTELEQLGFQLLRIGRGQA